MMTENKVFDADEFFEEVQRCRLPQVKTEKKFLSLSHVSILETGECFWNLAKIKEDFGSVYNLGDPKTFAIKELLKHYRRRCLEDE